MQKLYSAYCSFNYHSNNVPIVIHISTKKELENLEIEINNIINNNIEENESKKIIKEWENNIFYKIIINNKRKIKNDKIYLFKCEFKFEELLELKEDTQKQICVNNIIDANNLIKKKHSKDEGCDFCYEKLLEIKIPDPYIYNILISMKNYEYIIRDFDEMATYIFNNGGLKMYIIHNIVSDKISYNGIIKMNNKNKLNLITEF